MSAVFSDLILKGRTSLANPAYADSRDWFRYKASLVGAISPNRVIAGNADNQRNNVLPGYMYLFNYDAKTKDQLPYWDRFPLIFPFKMEADSFLGINLHYLPPLYRAKLMDALYDLVSNKNFDEKTKLRLSYDMLNASARYKYFEPCIKRYLKSHVKSRFLLIPSNEWDIALFLPLERFTTGSNLVYQESINKLRRM